MSSIYDWSLTEASNANADSSINWQEGQLPSTVNNSARYMMRRGKELLNDLGFVATAGGTANAITLTASSPFSVYADGMFVTFRAALDNTGAATLNVNAAGAKNIYKNSLIGALALVGGEIPAGTFCKLVYVASLNAAAGGWMIVESSKAPVSRGYVSGLILSNNASDATNDIDIAAGEAASDVGSPILMTLAAAITKRLDAAWAVGTGNGGLDTGAKANSTGYHVWLIQRSDTGVTDALFSLSGSAPTMPANYDRKVKIGCVITDGAGAIRPFIQAGNKFVLTATFVAISLTGGSAGNITNNTLTLPTGVRYDIEVSGSITSASSWALFLYTPGVTPDVQDLVARGGAGAVEAIGIARILSNTSSQITTAGSVASMTITLALRGWTYPRGE